MAKVTVDDFSFLDGAVSEFERDLVERMVRDHWNVNDSPITDYASRAPINGDTNGLLNILDDTIGYDESNVGLDIAGGRHGAAILDLVEMGFLRHGGVTNYQDRRRDELKDPRIDHLSGDLAHPATWLNIIKWQQQVAPEGLALVLHRPVGGLQKMEPAVYKGAALKVLDMVREEGIFFVQIPRSLKSDYAKRQLYSVCKAIRKRRDVKSVTLTDHKGPNYIRNLPYPKTDYLDDYVIIQKA